MNRFALLSLALGCLLLAQCRTSEPTPIPDPLSQLPPATQTGANTFGCLVNGQPYTPSGYNGSSNYVVIFDPTFQGGNLQVETYGYGSANSSSYKQSLSFALDGIRSTGQYAVTGHGNQHLLYTTNNKSRPCDWYSTGDSIYVAGTLTITQLDAQAGIISGTFAFTLAQPGCDTIKVTQGRFDKKL